MTRYPQHSRYTFFPIQPDIQMIIHIPFTENVRLRSVLLKIGISPLYMGSLALMYRFKAEAISLLVICGYTPTTTLSSVLSMQRAPILNSTSPYSRAKLVWQSIPSALQHSRMFIPFRSFLCVQVHCISKPLIWPQTSERICGRRHIKTVLCWIQRWHSVGQACGSFIAGCSRSEHGGCKAHRSIEWEGSWTADYCTIKYNTFVNIETMNSNILLVHLPSFQNQPFQLPLPKAL